MVITEDASGPVRDEPDLAQPGRLAGGSWRGHLGVPEAGAFMCDQFPEVYVSPTLAVFGGEIRSRAAMLKLHTMECKVPRIVMAHNRELAEDDDDNPEVPLPVAPEETRLRPDLGWLAVAGFDPKPPIDAFMPVTVI